MCKWPITSHVRQRRRKDRRKEGKEVLCCHMSCAHAAGYMPCCAVLCYDVLCLAVLCYMCIVAIPPGPLLRLQGVDEVLSKAQRYGQPYERYIHSSAIPPHKFQVGVCCLTQRIALHWGTRMHACWCCVWVVNNQHWGEAGKWQVEGSLSCLVCCMHCTLCVPCMHVPATHLPKRHPPPPGMCCVRLTNSTQRVAYQFAILLPHHCNLSRNNNLCVFPPGHCPELPRVWPPGP